MLAELGYIAIAVDMYGEGKIAAEPKEAGQLATPFYKDFQLDVERLQAAANKLKEYPQTDVAKVAAIGYCFGGSMVLNAAKIGMDFKGVVSFHGGLGGAPVNKDLLKEVEAKNFRLDLYHRLSVILIHVPSLNERRDDIPLLVDQFLEDICSDYGIAQKADL